MSCLLHLEETPGRNLRLSLSGRLSLEEMRRFERDAWLQLGKKRPTQLTVDLENLDYLDSAGALSLLSLKAWARNAGAAFALVGMSRRIEGILTLLDEKDISVRPLIPEKTFPGIFPAIGEASVTFSRDFVAVMSFVGDLVLSVGDGLIHPRSLRGSAILTYMKRVGVDGFPIVTLISLLLGMIIAFMSSLQLRQFGANTYVASLVGFAMVRELGPIMTAILVAGRSGSAFSAEIGSMVVNEEVDALLTMGFDPMKFLVLPKVLAAMMVIPLLTLYADLFGILGGMIVGILGLDLTAASYLQQSMNSFKIFDFFSSMIKSVVFAVLIAAISCQRGFQVRGGADAVGEAATSAVVSSIFLIIVADSAFAIILYYI